MIRRDVAFSFELIRQYDLFVYLFPIFVQAYIMMWRDWTAKQYAICIHLFNMHVKHKYSSIIYNISDSLYFFSQYITQSTTTAGHFSMEFTKRYFGT